MHPIGMVKMFSAMKPLLFPYPNAYGNMTTYDNAKASYVHWYVLAIFSFVIGHLTYRFMHPDNKHIDNVEMIFFMMLFTSICAKKMLSLQLSIEFTYAIKSSLIFNSS